MISVIIPVYNTQAFLSRCVASVRKQTFTDWELILVDDGSHDGSGALCDALAADDARIKVIHRPNGGASAARNDGIAAASGDEIAFIDSDDEVHPRYLEMLHSLREKYRAEVSAVARTEHFDQERKGVCQEQVCSGREAMAQMLYQRGVMDSSPCKLFDADVVRRCRFDGRCRVYEDLEWLSRLYPTVSRCAYSSLPLYLYVKRPTGTLSSASLRRTDPFDVTGLIEQRMAEAGDGAMVKAARSRRLSVSFHVLRLLAASPMPVGEPAATALAQRCWQNILELRCPCLADPQLRWKNRAGILLSLLGLRVTLFTFKTLSRS